MTPNKRVISNPATELLTVDSVGDLGRTELLPNSELNLIATTSQSSAVSGVRRSDGRPSGEQASGSNENSS